MERLSFLPTLPSLLDESGQPYVHRDLSWLQFNERVLAEARAPQNPLLERMKFLAITAANLDEFFMIRFASLGREIGRVSKTLKDADESEEKRHERAHLLRIRKSLLESVAKFGAKQSEALDLLSAEIEAKNIFLVRNPVAEDPAFDIGRRIFAESVLPQLGPPKPFEVSALADLLNLEMAAIFPRLKLWFLVPLRLPPVFFHSEGVKGPHYAFFLDDLLRSHLAAACRLEGVPGLLRMTRDGDIGAEWDAMAGSSMPEMIRSTLNKRELGRPVRLQYRGAVGDEILNHCVSRFKLVTGQVLPSPGTLCLHGLWTVLAQMPAATREQGNLEYPALTPFIPVNEMSGDPERIFARVRVRDVLLHHPYDSFDAYVRWIEAAAKDPKVTRIQQTIYRMDVASPVIPILKQAAAAGKQVRVFIELRARFDESNNLRLADELRQAGVEVAFGFGKLKLHAKVALLHRQEEDGVRRYTHLSTGNYNSRTARMYEDLGLLTAQSEVGEDAEHFFDAVFAGRAPSTFKKLVPAPTRLHKRLEQLIQNEIDAARAGRPARIFAKMNALVDKALIAKLYEASQAGVKIDLIVRGACSLIPGVDELSHNIRVISVVDRYLEHSRIYFFGDAQAMYLSSADWMPRNLFKRLELAFPVLDPDIYAFIRDVVIPIYLSDTLKARELTPQGTWKKRTLSSVRGYLKSMDSGVASKAAIRAQFVFEELARRTYRDTPLWQSSASRGALSANTEETLTQI